MEFLNMFLPIVLYILLSILLVILIILGLRILRVIDKLELLADDVSSKVKSLNTFFNLIDNFTDKMSIFSDKIVMIATTLLSKLFNKKGKDDTDEQV